MSADDTVPVPQCLLKPLPIINERLLAGADGPNNLAPRVKVASILPTVTGSPALFAVFHQLTDDVRAGLQYVFQTSSPYVFCLSGPGASAVECMACNLLEPGELLLIVGSDSVAAVRMKQTAQRSGVDVTFLSSTAAHQAFTVDDVHAALVEHRPKAIFIVHGDSSTGKLQPIKQLGQLCHRYNCLLIVDAVSTVGAVPFYMDTWEVDAVYTGAETTLSAMNGITPVAFSSLAWTKITNRRKRRGSRLMDAQLLASFWGATTPRLSSHSPHVMQICTLREALAMLVDEGLAAVWERQKMCAELLRSGLTQLGLDILITDTTLRLASVTVVKVPTYVKDSSAAIEYMTTRCNVSVSEGVDRVDGGQPVWRIGIMGYNARPEVVSKVIDALSQTLHWAKSC